jgi:FO synthase
LSVPSLEFVLRAAAADSPPDDATALERLANAPLEEIAPPAEALALAGFGPRISYSRKVFIPLTQLCRNVCHYCTFAHAPRHLPKPYLTLDDVVAIAREGARAGCKEALFTLGDKPELRYRVARESLAALGAATTTEYVARAARAVIDETGLLPHINSGVLSADELRTLRPHSVSMGLMLESASARLCERGGPHFGSPDKRPQARLESLNAAGALRIPYTSGLLIGIGETRRERVEALLALREVHRAHGHLQEIIIQNFRAKPGTAMAHAPEPALEEQLWTIAVARLVFGSSMSIQAPPNLQPDALEALARSGINDWGGVSPVTPDFVNPEAPWPNLVDLARRTEDGGRELVERLAITPAYALRAVDWVDAALRPRVLHAIDAFGYVREDAWHAGSALDVAPGRGNTRRHDDARAAPAGFARPRVSAGLHDTLQRLADGVAVDESRVARLFAARGAELEAVVAAADALRREVVGDRVSYVVNRNINYTNICTYHCGFCAFSKGRSARSLRGPGYLIDSAEIEARTREAWQHGATEVCLQGGIHPQFTGDTYLEIVAAVKRAVPGMHVHAFSPLEVTHGARTLGLGLGDYLRRLQAAGLATLPGTAAEILDDEVRRIICPDKLDTGAWLEVMRTAHEVGLRSTATIMYGHVDTPLHWARHLARVRALQQSTGGFTEFVPLAFVHMEAPLWRKGLTRSGPTFREALLMHAIARLVLHPVLTNVQTSWVKMGPAGAARCLEAGANDLGGTLMNESITRAAGGAHGQEMDAVELTALAASVGREAWQRTTLYEPAPPRASSRFRPLDAPPPSSFAPVAHECRG